MDCGPHTSATLKFEFGPDGWLGQRGTRIRYMAGPQPHRKMWAGPHTSSPNHSRLSYPSEQIYEPQQPVSFFLEKISIFSTLSLSLDIFLCFLSSPCPSKLTESASVSAGASASRCRRRRRRSRSSSTAIPRTG